MTTKDGSIWAIPLSHYRKKPLKVRLNDPLDILFNSKEKPVDDKSAQEAIDVMSAVLGVGSGAPKRPPDIPERNGSGLREMNTSLNDPLGWDKEEAKPITPKATRVKDKRKDKLRRKKLTARKARRKNRR